MLRLLETIKLKNGVLQNLHLHNERMNRSSAKLFGHNKPIILHKFNLPIQEFKKGIYKYRVVYSDKIEKVDVIPYQINRINTLKIVSSDFITYDHKYEDRKPIENLMCQRKIYDDILIIKNGFVTDTSYCNIVFDTGKKLYTPSTPLLKGIKRELLLSKGIIEEAEIKYNDIHLFEKAYLINSMIDLEDNVEILVNNIR